jgi:hypothetical protein
MSNKIVVPEEMLKAVADGIGVGVEPCRRILEAALRWLLENPIVPSNEQRYELTVNARNLDVPSTQRFQNMIAEWQSRMFLAPEQEISPAAKRAIECFHGCTLTPEDADAVVKELGYVAHGWSGLRR